MTDIPPSIRRRIGISSRLYPRSGFRFRFGSGSGPGSYEYEIPAEDRRLLQQAIDDASASNTDLFLQGLARTAIKAALGAVPGVGPFLALGAGFLMDWLGFGVFVSMDDVGGRASIGYMQDGTAGCSPCSRTYLGRCSVQFDDATKTCSGNVSITSGISWGYPHDVRNNPPRYYARSFLAPIFIGGSAFGGGLHTSEEQEGEPSGGRLTWSFGAATLSGPFGGIQTNHIGNNEYELVATTFDRVAPGSSCENENLKSNVIFRKIFTSLDTTFDYDGTGDFGDITGIQAPAAGVPDISLDKDDLQKLIDELRRQPPYDTQMPNPPGDDPLPRPPGGPWDEGWPCNPGGIGDPGFDPDPPGQPPYNPPVPPPNVGPPQIPSPGNPVVPLPDCPEDVMPGEEVELEAGGQKFKGKVQRRQPSKDPEMDCEYIIEPPPYTDENFKKDRCYKNALVVDIMEELAVELGMDPELLIIDPDCEVRFTGCFKKGTSKFDALWDMADLCGYGVFPEPPGGGQIGPIKPLPVFHGPYHEDALLGTYSGVYDPYERSYDALEMYHSVEYYRPNLPNLPGFSVVSLVNTSPFSVPEDKVEQHLAPKTMTVGQAQNAADARAAQMSARGATATFVIPLNMGLKQRHQCEIRRPSRGISIQYMVLQIRHEFESEGYVTAVEGRELGVRRYTPAPGTLGQAAPRFDENGEL